VKYETPELTALMPALNAIQSTPKPSVVNADGAPSNEHISAYQDWE